MAEQKSPLENDKRMERWQSELMRGMAWSSFLCYLLFLLLRLRDGKNGSGKIWYGAGFILLVVHVALAFQWQHGWSHERAWEETRERSGYGDGIFANYALVIVWGLDFSWLVCWPVEYERRACWLHRMVQGFLLFMWFWATTFFARWPLAIAGWTAFGLLLLAWRGKRAAN